jgi:hypothetical protein
MNTNGGIFLPPSRGKILKVFSKDFRNSLGDFRKATANYTFYLKEQCHEIFDFRLFP